MGYCITQTHKLHIKVIGTQINFLDGEYYTINKLSI